MHTQQSMVGAGFTPSQCIGLADSARNLTASGTIQADAVEFKAALSYFTTVPAGSGALLSRQAQPGDTMLVFNGGVNTLKVYPQLGDTINGLAADTPVSVSPNSPTIFACHDAQNWSALFAASQDVGPGASPSFTGLTVTGLAAFGAGAVGAPSIHLSSDVTTGFYRPAADQLAVTVAGAQRGLWSSTGLSVTGGYTSSTGAITSTSTSPGFTFNAAGIAAAGGNWIAFFQTNGVTQVQIDRAGLILASEVAPIGGNNTGSIGESGDSWASGWFTKVVTPTVDSGTAGPLSLKTNNGTEQFRISHLASAVRIIQAAGGGTGVNPFLQSIGETNTGFDFFTTGTGTLRFFTNNSPQQFEILHTASATRWPTVTGSNGGNPVVDVSAGALRLSAGTSDIQWGKALVALGGGAAPTFGTIGGSGPATAAQNTWMRALDSAGNAFWVPAWK